MPSAPARRKPLPKKHPFPPEELRRLWRLAWAGDEAAQKRLELGYSYLVKRRAHAFQQRHPGAPLEDLLGYAQIGIVKAVRHWRDGNGGNFVGHAARWVDSELKQGLSNLEGGIRVPRDARLKLERMKACGQLLLAELGREPAVGEILARLGMGEGDLKEAAAAAVGGNLGLAMLALDNRAKSPAASGLPPELKMLCESTDTPEQQVLSTDMNLWRAALDKTGDRYRFILCERWGWAGRPCRTLREVGEALGLSRGRVHQLEWTAVYRLFRAALAARLLTGPLEKYGF